MNKKPIVLGIFLLASFAFGGCVAAGGYGYGGYGYGYGYESYGSYGDYAYDHGSSEIPSHFPIRPPQSWPVYEPRWIPENLPQRSIQRSTQNHPKMDQRNGKSTLTFRDTTKGH